jgi:hypothetical protein
MLGQIGDNSMTKAYEKLQQAPQPAGEIDIGDLNFDERREVQTLRVRSTAGSGSQQGGKFSDVHYLGGDEKRAIGVFAEMNREIVDNFDFTGRNVVQTSLSRPLYDLLLSEVGQRSVRKYTSVVVEQRPGGKTWIIPREVWEKEGTRRYERSAPVARVPEQHTLESLFEEAPDTISKTYFSEHGVIGTLDPLIDFYLDCGLYECEEVTVDGVRGVQKQ